ncbi:MAG: putative rane protein [Propionibacteriaceae bacterium]|jgi:uncharacterized membrane protein HdeD (DUF308 family)|nr:putative rane protein [Propionibacteriaceae bacterium]
MDLGRSLSWLLILRGILAILFGIVALIWPGLTAVALAIVFGVYVLIDGAGLVVSGIRGKNQAGQFDRGRRVLFVVAGLIGIAAGIGTLIWPDITVIVLALWAGAWAVLTGASEIGAAIRLRKEMTGEWLLILVGALSVIAGLLIFLRPDIGALALAQLLGVYGLIAGVLLLIAGWRVRRAVSATVPVPE